MARDEDIDAAEGAPASGGDDTAVADETVTRHLFALGSSDGMPPLAAVFKTRGRGGRRRRDSEPPEGDPRAEPASERRKTPPPEHFRATPSEPPRPAQQTPSPPPVDPPSALLAPPVVEQRPSRPADPEPAASVEEVDDNTVEQVAATPPGLESVIPPNADPVWARDAVLSLATQYVSAHRTPSEGAWFAELFRNEYLLAHPMRDGKATAREAELIERALSVASGGRILDLCCGYGRHTISLARRGYEVVGLDLSMDLLQHALNRAHAEALSIKFVHGDMRDLHFEEVFDGAFCADTSFGAFEDVENIHVLRGVHRALKRGGRLLIDVINRDYAVLEIPNRNWWEGRGCLVQEDIEFDYRSSRLRIKRFLVFADGMERVYDISLRLFSLHELVRMLELVGFRVVQTSGSLHTAGAFFGPQSERIIVTAEKV